MAKEDKQKRKLNKAFQLDLDTYLEIVELAKSNGKKSGDSMQREFEEIMKLHPEKIKYLGETEQVIDLLTGNLRENKIRVLNLKEIERKQR